VTTVNGLGMNMKRTSVDKNYKVKLM